MREAANGALQKTPYGGPGGAAESAMSAGRARETSRGALRGASRRASRRASREMRPPGGVDVSERFFADQVRLSPPGSGRPLRQPRSRASAEAKQYQRARLSPT